MKRLLFISLLLPAVCKAQSFATLEGHIAATGNENPGYGLTFSGGGYLKPAHNFQLGLGITVNYYRDFFMIPFLQAGYFNPRKKISPYINARLGYSFTKFKVFDNVHSNKGGVYVGVRAGCGIKISKLARITPFIEMQSFNLRYLVNREVVSTSNKGVFAGGIAFIFGR